MTNTKLYPWKLNSTYSSLPESFFKPVKPTPTKNPSLVVWNESLAEELGISDFFTDPIDILSLFSGNTVPETFTTLAQAYAGHQFGNFTMLGDGRAILLGEHKTQNSQVYDIQLKGSGKTPFSRGGDGRATLSAMLREYIISESMFALGIPTTRSLAVLKTGETVYREEASEGAILTRVAKSHIRVGTFEYAYHFLETEDLQKLVDYTLERHYPEIKNKTNKALSLLEEIMNGQIDLLVHWMRVGFIHGVMNTDNTSLACETIDYGPCAFMNVYDPATVFSSIDVNGRYAYGNQPGIIHWNLACFANTLLPLVDQNEKIAIEKVREILDLFPSIFEKKYWNMLGNKIGFEITDEEDQELIKDLLRWMKTNNADYTNTFLSLEPNLKIPNEIYKSESFVIWKKKWAEKRQSKGITIDQSEKLLKETNPFLIPRNHKVELALKEAKEGNFGEMTNLLKKLKNPYERNLSIDLNLELPNKSEDNYKTFCGT